jgi:hypothetical protein
MELNIESDQSRDIAQLTMSGNLQGKKEGNAGNWRKQGLEILSCP